MMRFNGFLRFTFAVALTASFAGNVWAQDVTPQAQSEAAPAPAAKSAGPVATVAELKHDFGQVWGDDQLKHSFTITNTGDAVLRITKVKPSCGCTAAGKHPKQLAPGESGKFPFRLNAKKLHGKFTKSIAVTTNDPKNKMIRLSLAGVVKHLVETSPRLAQFGRVKVDSVLTRKITITNNSDDPMTLKVAKNAAPGCFSTEITETEPGKVFELTVKAQPPFKTGINRSTLTLETNLEKHKKLSVICMATMPERLELRPNKIQLVPNSKAQTPRRIALTNNGDTPVNILSAVAEDETLTVATRAIEAGKRHQITVTFPAGYEVPKNGTSIIITTDDAEKAELRIPVTLVKRRTPQKRERPQMKMLGKAAPEHKTTAQGGSEVTVGGKGDKVQFVAFYASWCGFCKKALPKVEELYQNYKDNENVEIVVVNLDDRTGRRKRTEEQSLEHYKSLKLTMPLILDAEKKIGKDYKVTSFPSMYVVGKSGEVEAVHVGAAKGFEKIVAKEIELLLAGKTRADFPKAKPVAKRVRPKPVARGAARPVDIVDVPVKNSISARKAKAEEAKTKEAENKGGR